jgi:DNA-binding LacI/PurR family transcriptional regulator
LPTATIRDVAQKAGVGVGTVSRVLNESGSVSPDTRARVLAAIAELDFSPNTAARRLSRGKTMVVGALVPFDTSPSVVRRLQGAISVMVGSPYDLILLFDVESAGHRHEYLSKMLRRQMLDGLLILSIFPTDEDVRAVQALNVPTMVVDGYHPALNRLMVDNVAGGYMATRHLLALGHRRVAFISDYLDDPFNSPVQERFEGYKRALAEAGLPYRPEYHKQRIHGRVEARHMTHQLLTMPEPPTAIFAHSDTQAIGAIEEAKALGVPVPSALSIVGFDNLDVSEFLQLTTIRQGLHESGVLGAQRLLEMMTQEDTSVQEIVLPVELVVRQTTAPPAVA